MIMLTTGALLPDPVYLLIPFVCGSGIMSLTVTILWALGVSS